MIFVTVGTHEQQFNRLIKEIDRLKKEGIIQEDVLMQTGFSTYEPKYCEWKKMLSYNEMNEMYEKADIIITHGGPASFMKALEMKKVPIVVPRQAQFDEHVNDHQVDFVKLVEDRFNNIIGVYDIADLENVIVNFNQTLTTKNASSLSHNKEFNEKLEFLIRKELN
ncbi:PssE/Cps14G family polysaccharide biosynthesis glycosyltransferase [Thomasclavelia spiroformis]|uniref:PssE/Cps14G family polysaccharide biosynthesis glycosyltransferase n=1 Tax=Thomasclavelia spiroformis TaxID=29348 RepID=UPI0024B069AC|nr:PssE/Cps14G family polysaccharide biosynthesis glycosyltransferase [Thomasclavelia spiroformis]